MNDPEGTDRTLERLSEEYAELKSEKDGLAGQIKQLEKSLDELSKALKEQFGSDELKKLQQLLEKKEAENNKKSQQYEEHLEELKEKLAALEEAVENDEPVDEADDDEGDES